MMLMSSCCEVNVAYGVLQLQKKIYFIYKYTHVYMAGEDMFKKTITRRSKPKREDDNQYEKWNGR